MQTGPNPLAVATRKAARRGSCTRLPSTCDGVTSNRNRPVASVAARFSSFQPDFTLALSM